MQQYRWELTKLGLNFYRSSLFQVELVFTIFFKRGSEKQRKLTKILRMAAESQTHAASFAIDSGEFAVKSITNGEQSVMISNGQRSITLSIQKVNQLISELD